jgi:hypothetical protein
MVMTLMVMTQCKKEHGTNHLFSFSFFFDTRLFVFEPAQRERGRGKT